MCGREKCGVCIGRAQVGLEKEQEAIVKVTGEGTFHKRSKGDIVALGGYTIE